MKAILFDLETRRHIEAASRRHSLRQLLRRAVTVLREWHRRHRGRGELATLDDRMLRDIGITRVEALYEIDKPFWRK